MAGCSLRDVVKAIYIIANAEDWPLIYPVIGDHMREFRPAATAFVSDLVDPRMKVEIEVTARRSDH